MSKKKVRPQPSPAEYFSGLTDSHTHIASAGAVTDEQVVAYVARAQAAGVEYVCTVGDTVVESEQALAAACVDARVVAACALHPTRADQLDEQAKVRLAQLAAHPRCVAIGETGLDRYWIEHDPQRTAAFELQEEAFRWHIELAVSVSKPVMIHNRDADVDVFRIVEDSPRAPHTILHCFSSSFEVGKKAVDHGYMISFSGNSTFKRNEHLRALAAHIPLENILVETDAPYMTPEPFRGCPNETSLIGHTFVCLAEARGMRVEEFVQHVRHNFLRVYGIS